MAPIRRTFSTAETTQCSPIHLRNPVFRQAANPVVSSTECVCTFSASQLMFRLARILSKKKVERPFRFSRSPPRKVHIFFKKLLQSADSSISSSFSFSCYVEQTLNLRPGEVIPISLHECLLGLSKLTDLSNVV